ELFLPPLSGLRLPSLHCAHRATTVLSWGLCEHRERTASAHNRTSMMVDDPPLLPYPFVQVGGEDSAFLSRVALPAGDVLRTDHPGHIPGHLDLNLSEIELHREGVVEDQDPGISHSRPADSQGPARMNAGDILLLRPNPIHPRNV